MATRKRQLPADQRRAIGVRILERCRTKRWTQREFARRIGIRYMRLSRLENGHVTLNLPELLLIAEELDAGLEELVWGVENRPPAALPELESFGTPEECAILRKLLWVLEEGLKAIRPNPSEEQDDANP